MARLYLIGIVAALAAAAIYWYLRRKKRKSPDKPDQPFTGNVDATGMPPASHAQPVASEAWEAEARNLVRAGRKIEAVKLVRERTGLDLKSAKDYAERL